MDKITFLGAGSTVFAKNVLGDCITTDAMREFEYALYDIDHQRLEESYMMLSNINRNSNDGKASPRPPRRRPVEWGGRCSHIR